MQAVNLSRDASSYYWNFCSGNLSYVPEGEVVWRKDGTRFPVEYTSAPIVTQDKITGAVIVIRDVTERRKAEEEINRLNKELEHRVIQRTMQLEAVIRELESEETDHKRTGEKLRNIPNDCRTSPTAL